MAGRGRGKPNLSFEIGSLGFGAGEALPTQTLQPPSTYPPLQQRPTPLSSTEVDEYLLALSQEYRGSIKDSMFYLKPSTIKKDIVRYTDRYKQTNQKVDAQNWEPDRRFFPVELKPAIKRKVTNKSIAPNLNGAKKKTISKVIDSVDVTKKLDELVQKEATEVGGGTENAEGENVEGEEVEEEIEEEYEDDNDYNFDYYDDGGDNYGDDDDGEEGPVYS